MKALTHNFVNYCGNIMSHDLAWGISWGRNKLELTAAYNSNSEKFCMKKSILLAEKINYWVFFSFFFGKKNGREYIHCIFFFTFRLFGFSDKVGLF